MSEHTPKDEAALQAKASEILRRTQDELKDALGVDGIGFVAFLVFPNRVIEVGHGCRSCCLQGATDSLVEIWQSGAGPQLHRHGTTH